MSGDPAFPPDAGFDPAGKGKRDLGVGMRGEKFSVWQCVGNLRFTIDAFEPGRTSGEVVAQIERWERNDSETKRYNPGQGGTALRNKGLGGGTNRETW